ncbi:hypothetical protein DAPPUDRAFT_115491 [Daphnia pulex]|uniref:Uncharacterized protein n=1 Tax=Daphnia pulex TaxID=6669 RepID=E9HLK1_DAPPU|nr:hypothetical protein DAPPUDRAFT_115491 [Daphnia pulex]|eukprot:EFX67365.1 hypothetical protein DAPPUDRAFT_115491 [Daphnia pulex]
MCQHRLLPQNGTCPPPDVVAVMTQQPASPPDVYSIVVMTKSSSKYKAKNFIDNFMLTNDRISVLVICCLFLSLGVDGAPLNWFPHPFLPAGANSAMEKILSDYDNKVGDNRPFIVEDDFFDLSADQFGDFLKFIRNQADYETLGNVIPSYLDLLNKVSLTREEDDGTLINNPKSPLAGKIHHCADLAEALKKSLESRMPFVLQDTFYVLGKKPSYSHLTFSHVH